MEIEDIDLHFPPKGKQLIVDCSLFTFYLFLQAEPDQPRPHLILPLIFYSRLIIATTRHSSPKTEKLKQIRGNLDVKNRASS